MQNRVGARRFARRRALCQWRRFGLRRADRGLCDHFATVVPGSAPVNAVAWAADILATVDQDGGLALWD